jgi:uncharacterized membrane protein
MRKPQISRQFFQSFEAKALSKRSLLTRFADTLTAWCGSAFFLLANAIIFFLWILINSDYFPFIPTFDPYPFGLLTMIVSLEAIFLSIFVLISQNRSSNTSTLRDEVNLQVNMITEQEVTKILQLLAEMRRQMGINKVDRELDQMIQRINENRIEQEIESQIAAAHRGIIAELRRAVKPRRSPAKSSAHGE